MTISVKLMVIDSSKNLIIKVNYQGCRMKVAKTIFTYALIIAIGLLIGYVAPRLPMLLKPAYQEGDYSAHFLNTKTKVLMYGTANCAFCKKTRAYFAENKIDYVDMDVEKSPAAAAKHAELGAEAVPVILIGKRMIRGYQPEAFAEALRALEKTQTAEK
ncbi:glutaredoxin family protein [Undibacterium sp. Di27W]|uniref:glutaredoxin family protein n=1 Tax=Undibacterium sp. Di27W TaxID=3413036 RepID=UPI003BF410AB